jgi:HEPN domain-containing protein
MLDHDEFRRWRAEALGALEAARLAGDGGRHNWACFLCEQSGQLAMKGVLHGLGAAPWGHDLVDLGRRLSASLVAPLAVDLADALRRLSRHYIPARYPDAQPGGSPGERYVAADATEAIAQAELVIGVVDGLWAQLAAEDALEAGDED